MSDRPFDLGRAVLFDPSPGRELESLIRAAGPRIETHSSLERVGQALAGGVGAVAIVAFEALGADPQGALRRLRQSAPDARLIMIHEEDSARLRLVRRLWSSGACDVLVPLSSITATIKNVIRQAAADAAADRSVHGDADNSAESLQLRFLLRLAAAVSGQGSAEGIVRELSFKLPDLLPCEVLAVLVLDESRPRLFIFQNAPVDHSVLWRLAEAACEVIAPFMDGPAPSPEELEFVHGAPPLRRPLEDGERTGSNESPIEPSAHAMVSSGEVVGSLVALPTGGVTLADRERLVLHVIAAHLATSLRHARMISRVAELTTQDALTGLPDRRSVPDILAREWSRAARYSLQLSLALIDLDRFREVNELHGRLVGNAVLEGVARLLRTFARNTDHLIRFGADEFLLILPETGAAGATVLVERIRVGLKTTPFTIDGRALAISISAGVGAHPTDGAASPSALLGAAESALFDAKAAGGNRTAYAGARQAPEGSLGTGEVEQRRSVRMSLELPALFLTLSDLDAEPALRVHSLNISAEGLALRDPSHRLKRGINGLVFFEDRPDPLLCQVAWVATAEGDHHAGLRTLRANDLLDAARGREVRERRALVISDLPSDRAAVRRALRSAQYEVEVLDPEQPIDPQILARVQLVILGASTLRTSFGQQLKNARHQGSLKIVVLNEELDRAHTIAMISEQQLEHLISARGNSEEYLFTTLSKLIRDDYFGVRRYLMPGADTKTWTVTDPSEKNYVLAGVRAVAAEVDCHPRIIDLLISAVDEMLINALYHPAAGSSPLKPVMVECGSDGRLLSVSVLDEHGLLQVGDLYASLGAALVQDQIPAAPESHLGFRIMLSSLSQVAINVEPGRRCEIIGIVDLRRTLGEHRAAAPSLGVFRRP